MIYKLGHVEDVENIAIADEKVKTAISDYLSVLDNAYGKDRNIDEDDGGYVLYCTAGTEWNEIESYFNYHDLPPEWVNHIDSEPKYLSVLYLLSSDYAVVVVMTEKDFKKEK